MSNWLLLLLATVALVCVPLAPQLLRLRLRFLRWINWTWAADLLENYFPRWVILLRTVLIIIALALFYFAWPL